MPIESVSKMLGPTSLRTTQIYAKVVEQKLSQDMKLLKGKLLENKYGEKEGEGDCKILEVQFYGRKGRIRTNPKNPPPDCRPPSIHTKVTSLSSPCRGKVIRHRSSGGLGRRSRLVVVP